MIGTPLGWTVLQKVKLNEINGFIGHMLETATNAMINLSFRGKQICLSNNFQKKIIIPWQHSLRVK